MENGLETAVSLLRRGQAPGHEGLLQELSVGFESIADFWREKYLNEYIALGGSKIKFVTGRGGSGKTHLLRLFSYEAAKADYVTASFSARDVWLHDFKEFYGEILRQADLMKCLQNCADLLIRALGHDPSQIMEGETFIDYLAGRGELDPIAKREIRLQLQEMFLNNPLIDNNFAIACSLLTGGLLGHPALEKQSQETLLAWLKGSQEASLPAVRRLGLSPSKITKINARHMLRSLAEVARLSGYAGLVVTVDELEILTSSDTFDNLRYTRSKREDAYESMRELIDEIDGLKNMMIVYAFDRKLIDDEQAGLKSYQALWMRIQNEVSSEKFNYFTDIVDLDYFMDQTFTPDVILEMSRKLTNVLNAFDSGSVSRPRAIGRSQAQEILSRAKFGNISMPRLVNMATLGQEPAQGQLLFDGEVG